MGIRGRVKRLHANSSRSEAGKKKSRFRIPIKLSLSGVAILAVFVVFGGVFIQTIVKSMIDSIGLYIDNRKLEARIDELYYEKQVLLEQQDNLLNEAEIEQEAKEKLGLLKPGEVLIVLEDINE